MVRRPSAPGRVTFPHFPQTCQHGLRSKGDASCEGPVTILPKPMTMARQDLARVERAARHVAESREELRVAIGLARAAGETLDDIARAAGVTRQAVSRMLQRIEDDQKRRGG